MASDAHADTTGVYTVKLRGRIIETTDEFSTIRLTFNSDSINNNDTLFIDYWSCGPRPGGKYRTVITVDSVNSDTVYHAIRTSEDYILPLQPILEWNKKHPGAVFVGRFKQMTGTSREVIRFEIRFTE